ncbi:MAG: hypothetical protein LEGION0403_FIIPPAGN_01403 [Legionella sp.]|uniref:hypothetical protein n=1 Tax=Legionella sp. TaxID=459 RepID=UPI003D09D3BE
MQVDDKISIFDVDELKNSRVGGLIAVISSLLKYCCMLIPIIFLLKEHFEQQGQIISLEEETQPCNTLLSDIEWKIL